MPTRKAGSRYIEKRKKFIKELKKYNSIDILNYCIHHTYTPVENRLKETEKYPWLILLLIKWTFIYKSEIKYKKKKLSESNIKNILSMMYDLGNEAELPNKKDGIRIIMKNLAHQQFMYHTPASFNKICRQELILSASTKNQKIKNWFYKKHGLYPDEFIKLSIITIANFSDKSTHTLKAEYFSNLYKSISYKKIDYFLDSISTNISQLQFFLKKNNKSKPNGLEYYEQTPFLSSPLIKEKSNYICVNPYILNRCFEYFIYDSLRESHPNEFMEVFGPAFEDYIRKGLNYSGLNFISEKEVKKHIKSNTKCVDFIISLKHCNIFIESKAVEMHHYGKIAVDPKIIKGKLKTNIIKAIEQANQFNNFILKNPLKNLLEYKPITYLLVVTMKELYIGNGQHFNESIGKKWLEEILKNIEPKAKINIPNIYFITVDNFDSIIALQKSKIINIEELINNAIKDDSNYKTSKFDFSQHLQHYEKSQKTPSPAYLKEKFDGICREIEDMLPST